MLKKLTCTKTLLAIASTVILLASNFGIKLDNELVMTTIESICYILVLLGVMNDEGMTTDNWNE